MRKIRSVVSILTVLILCFSAPVFAEENQDEVRTKRIILTSEDGEDQVTLQVQKGGEGIVVSNAKGEPRAVISWKGGKVKLKPIGQLAEEENTSDEQQSTDKPPKKFLNAQVVVRWGEKSFPELTPKRLYETIQHLNPKEQLKWSKTGKDAYKIQLNKSNGTIMNYHMKYRKNEAKVNKVHSPTEPFSITNWRKLKRLTAKLARKDVEIREGK